jgi:hypothetical protein
VYTINKYSHHTPHTPNPRRASNENETGTINKSPFIHSFFDLGKTNKQHWWRIELIFTSKLKNAKIEKKQSCLPNENASKRKAAEDEIG